MRKLKCSVQSLFSFKALLTNFSKQTLAVTPLFLCNFFLVVAVGIRLAVVLLFQCNFFLVVGADNLV